MNRTGRIAAALLAVIGAAGASPPVSGDDPADYALRTTVIAAPGALVQRIDLPAVVLAAAQTPDLTDVRLFDAAGRALPIARVAPRAAPQRQDRLRPLPILAPADRLQVTGVSLRLDAAGQPRLASLSGTRTDTEGAVVAGYLFDARSIAGRADRLTLDADIPAGQPITFTVEAGASLNTWRTIGESVVYREPGMPPAPTLLPLGGSAIDRDYLRVSWRAGGRLLAPVTISGATLLSGAGTAADVMVEAASPPLPSPAAFEFAVPFATPITTVRIVPSGGEMLVPIRILGRNDGEQPWTVLGRGIAGAQGSIPIGDASYRILRVEAAGAGFAAPPVLRFGLAPRAILFLAAGRGPFTLTAGRAGAADAYLPAETLTAGRTTATAGIAAPSSRLQLAAPDTRGARMRTALLWAMLLAGTAALAGMAWLLWRRMPGSALPD